jgi:hypothetical protein
MIAVKYPRPETITKNMNNLTTWLNNKSLSVFGQNSLSYSGVELMNNACWLIQLTSYVSSIANTTSAISSSIRRVKKIMMTLKRTENNISSFSLYSMHYFQMLNWSEACFPELLSPKDVMF